MANRTTDQAIADAEFGGKLVSNAAWGLVGAVRRAGGDGAAAIVASGLELAADAATAGSEVLSGIARQISEIDPRTSSPAEINAYLIWAGAASTAAAVVANGAAQAVIRAAEFVKPAAAGDGDVSGAVSDAQQGGVRFARAGETISLLVDERLSR